MDAFDPDRVGAFAEAAKRDREMAGIVQPAQKAARRNVAPESVIAFVGRPYLLWRENPELARMVNDRLAAPMPSPAKP